MPPLTALAREIQGQDQVGLALGAQPGLHCTLLASTPHSPGLGLTNCFNLAFPCGRKADLAGLSRRAAEAIREGPMGRDGGVTTRAPARMMALHVYQMQPVPVDMSVLQDCRRPWINQSHLWWQKSGLGWATDSRREAAQLVCTVSVFCHLSKSPDRKAEAAAAGTEMPAKVKHRSLLRCSTSVCQLLWKTAT